jgi:hypothetical protein
MLSLAFDKPSVPIDSFFLNLGSYCHQNVLDVRLPANSKNMSAPTCFISYSWDAPEHQAWVLKLATSLRSAGVDVLLDQWDVHPGTDLTVFMEQSISNSQYVLLVCTPAFAQKANLRKGGVGYEQSVVTGEIFQEKSLSEKKFVPILRSGDAVSSLPAFLKSRVFVDFRSDARFNESLEELLRYIHAAPRVPKPSLGSIPSFSKGPVMDPSNMSRFDLDLFKKLEQFAYLPSGLNLSQAEAKEWALERTRTWQSVDIDHFKQRFSELSDFAYLPSGLNLSRQDARDWALKEVCSEFGVKS